MSGLLTDQHERVARDLEQSQAEALREQERERIARVDARASKIASLMDDGWSEEAAVEAVDCDRERRERPEDAHMIGGIVDAAKEQQSRVELGIGSNLADRKSGRIRKARRLPKPVSERYVSWFV